MSMKTARDCLRIFAAWRLCDLALGSGTCRRPDQKATRPRNGPTGKPVARRRSGHEGKTDQRQGRTSMTENELWSAVCQKRNSSGGQWFGRGSGRERQVAKAQRREEVSTVRNIAVPASPP